MVTIIDGGGESEVVREVDARVEGERVVLSPSGMKSLGWELHPEGLCREGLCVPVPAGSGLEVGTGADLSVFARLIDRPVAIDLEEQAAYLGVSAGERGRALRSLVAPEFGLPDLSGRVHRLSEHRGKKVLLVAYASW